MKKDGPEQNKKAVNPLISFGGWLKSLFKRFIAQIKRWISWLKGAPEKQVEKIRQEIHQHILEEYESEKQIKKEATLIKQSDTILIRLNEQIKKQEQEIGHFEALFKLFREAQTAKLSKTTVGTLEGNYNAAKKLRTTEMEAQYIARSDAVLERLKSNTSKEPNDAVLVEINVIKCINEIKAITSDAKAAGMIQATVKRLVENYIAAQKLLGPETAKPSNESAPSTTPPAPSAEIASFIAGTQKRIENQAWGDNMKARIRQSKTESEATQVENEKNKTKPL